MDRHKDVSDGMVPFELDQIKVVPDEFITGNVLMRLQDEFRRTGSSWYGNEFMLDDWKAGRLRFAGVCETKKMYEHATWNFRWHATNFVKPGAPWSIFFAATSVADNGTPEVGWISSELDSRCIDAIITTLDPTGTCKHWKRDQRHF